MVHAWDVSDELSRAAAARAPLVVRIPCEGSAPAGAPARGYVRALRALAGVGAVAVMQTVRKPPRAICCIS